LYEELERVFDEFPKYNTKILLGHFNANTGTEYIFKPSVGNESLCKIGNDSGVRAVNFATSVLPHHSILNTLGLPLMGRHSHIGHVFIDKDDIQV